MRGILSYQEIFFLHFGQFDLPKIIVLSFGNLAMQTLTKLPKIKLKDLAQYPIVTYVFGFTGSNDLDRAFFERGLKANVVFTATDADVIKTYVKMGTGVGIIASMAFNPDEDTDLEAINANHLFYSGTTYMGFRRGT